MNSKVREVLFEIVRTLIAIMVALALALLIIFCVSNEPGNAIKSFLLGPFTSMRRFGNVLEMAIPFTFTGLAVCVMFQAKQFNMIAEGGFFIGAVAAAYIAIKVTLPLGIHPIVAILFGGVIGGVFGFIPGYLKAKWKANELVSSLMLNYILLYLGLYIINYVLRDPKAGAMASHLFNESAVLPKLIPSTRLTYGLIIAILMIIIVYYFLYRTRWGYSIRMTGLNENFTEYSGISVTKVIIYSQLIGGFIAGIGGATEMLGMYQRFQWQALPGYGFDGIIVGIISRYNPALVPIAAIFLAYLRVGADIMARTADVSSEVIAIIQGIMIMLIAAYSFLSTWRHKMIVKQSKESLKENLAVKGEN